MIKLTKDYSKEPKSVTALIYSLSFVQIESRSHLETVLDFRLVNVCMKECELIKRGHTLGFLAVN